MDNGNVPLGFHDASQAHHRTPSALTQQRRIRIGREQSVSQDDGSGFQQRS
jgi:hypothetical protein